MTRDRRKAAIAAYKERKKAIGIYLVRCQATGEAWVGQSPTLDSIQNRIWFTLGLGNNPNRGLQKAWADHGAESFVFEVVERLEDEEASSYLQEAHLKERLTHWQATLGATRLI